MRSTILSSKTSTGTSISTVALAAITTALCAGSTLTASVLDQVELTNGLSFVSTTIDGVTIDIASSGGNFQSKTVAGWLGTGVSGGAVNGEIDGNQSITFTFSEAVFITSLSVAHLYAAGNHGDQWHEAAKASTDAGNFLLAVTGDTTASWTGSGIVTNVSPGIEGHGGTWLVGGTDIFGAPITSLTLLSGNPGTGSKYGDFGFVSLSFAQVPAPGALALLAGLGVTTRRRRTA